jgi:hypothetical protein
LRGTEDPSQLTPEEGEQFTFYVMGFLRLVQDAYDRYQEGNISHRTWESIELLLMAHLSSKGMKAPSDQLQRAFYMQLGFVAYKMLAITGRLSQR